MRSKQQVIPQTYRILYCDYEKIIRLCRLNERVTEVKRIAHIAATVMIMLAVSGLLVRTVDAVVQIDDDTGMLILLIAAVNIIIGIISCRIFQKGLRSDKKTEV